MKTFIFLNLYYTNLYIIILKNKVKKIIIKGIVQGVGFRPFVYRIAKKYKLKGFVNNTTRGVEIFIESNNENLDSFLSELIKNYPPAAEIKSIEIQELGLYEHDKLEDFQIRESIDYRDYITYISPDISVCEECLKDMKIQEHRLNYPLVNCTNCGPRFSIIYDLPYDRNNTSMNEFEMCGTCKEEYNNPLDRRFHAQPVSCRNCGPKYYMIYKNKKIENLAEILSLTKELILDDKLIAIKGIGGFHILCNPFSYEAVEKLRITKKRSNKPFALMFRNIEKLKSYVTLNDKEINSLLSWRKPILILNVSEKKFPENIAPGLNTIGAFLPYMPFHYLIFDKIALDAVILTSCNISEEPIIKDEEIVTDMLKDLVDAIVYYNRKIVNRVDDSVVRIINDRLFIIRRSRGYTPEPIDLKWKAEGIIGTGAELSGSFCIGKENQAILSQYIGDLKNFETYCFYEEAYERFSKMFRFKPVLAVHDLHPDYLSTIFAKKLGVKTISIQHHYAHALACMIENNLDKKVLAVIFDGTGMGLDGKIWGSEFMIVDYESFERFLHFDYIELPGGDKAIEEPWRIAFSYLYRIYGRDLIEKYNFLFKNIDNNILQFISEMIEKNINCPLSCGAGRLFDAISALLGLCRFSTYHAEAPSLLESILLENINDRYEVQFQNNTIYFNEMFEQVFDDILNNVSKSIIATKFHNTIIYVIFKGLLKMRNETNINDVVISGGVFQNKYLTSRLINLLENNKFKVYTNKNIPCNDSGIALGQLAYGSYITYKI